MKVPSRDGRRAAGHAPGGLAWHMVRAEAAMRRSLRSVDVVWEVADARCPRASRNPRLSRICGDKPRVLILAKADLADAAATASYVAALRADGPVVALDLRQRPDLDRLRVASRDAMAPRRAPPELSAMVVGIPNTGKSTLLNRVSEGRHAAVGAAPGVTRGPQWLRVPGGGRVLDLPGILPPRPGGFPVTWRLWAIGALPGHSVDVQASASALWAWIAARRPRALTARYGAEASGAPPEEGLPALAAARGFRVTGGGWDVQRAAAALLDDLWKGRLGPVTLEDPPDGANGGDAPDRSVGEHRSAGLEGLGPP